MNKKLVFHFVLSFVCFSTYAQNIQGSLKRGSSSQHLVMVIKNNGSTAVTANLNTVKFSIGYGFNDMVVNKRFLPSGFIGDGVILDSTYYNFGTKVMIGWKGILPVTLNAGQTLDLMEFKIVNPTWSATGSSTIPLFGGVIERNHPWSVVMDGVEVSDQVNRFFNSGDILISPNGVVQMHNSEISSSAYFRVERSSALPVKLKTISATSESNNIKLHWSTTEETNSRAFDVQWSKDAKEWKTVGSVVSIGETKSLASYSFNHSSSHTGENYYRLKMIDVDNSFAYSRIVSANINGHNNIFFYPNPSSHSFKIMSTAKKILMVQLFDNLGNLVREDNYRDGSVDVSGLKYGTYNAKVSFDSGELETSRIVVVN
jgi:hypothetical protein